MTQDDCSEYRPAGDALEAAVGGKVLIDLNFDGRQIVYQLTDESGNKLVGYTDEDGYYLRVPQDTDVVFDLYLSPGKDWTFDAKNPFTLKQAEAARYFKVFPDPSDPQHITVQAKSTGQPSEKGRGVLQPYNLHVVLAQPGGSSIALKIDPEVKNPPPPNG